MDRLAIREDIRQRLADSIETALRWGEGKMAVIRLEPGAEDWQEQKFSTDYSNPSTGFTMPKLTPKHFSFNSHHGACPACHGIGTELFFDPELMVDGAKTLAQGAIRPWRVGQKRMRQFYAAILDALGGGNKGAHGHAIQGPCRNDFERSPSFTAAARRRLPSRPRRRRKTTQVLLTVSWRRWTSFSIPAKANLPANGCGPIRVAATVRGLPGRAAAPGDPGGDDCRDGPQVTTSMQFCELPIAEAEEVIGQLALSGTGGGDRAGCAA